MMWNLCQTPCDELSWEGVKAIRSCSNQPVGPSDASLPLTSFHLKLFETSCRLQPH